jgi:hypothetical protein
VLISNVDEIVQFLITMNANSVNKTALSKIFEAFDKFYNEIGQKIIEEGGEKYFETINLLFANDINLQHNIDLYSRGIETNIDELYDIFICTLDIPVQVFWFHLIHLANERSDFEGGDVEKIEHLVSVYSSKLVPLNAGTLLDKEYLNKEISTLKAEVLNDLQALKEHFEEANFVALSENITSDKSLREIKKALITNKSKIDGLKRLEIPAKLSLAVSYEKYTNADDKTFLETLYGLVTISSNFLRLF